MARLRCWWRPCSGEVELRQAVTLDRHGTPVDWGSGRIWEEPANYHPECAVLFQAACQARRELNGVAAPPEPGRAPVRSLLQVREEGPPRAREKKPEQLGLLDFLAVNEPEEN